MSEQTSEYIKYSAWQSYAHRLERAHLRQYHRSLTAASIAARAKNHIIEIREDDGQMLVRRGWRQAMQEAAQEPKGAPQ